MSVAATYVIDATIQDPRSNWDRAYDTRAVHVQVTDVLAVAPKGANVTLNVGKYLPTIIAGDDYWAELINDYAVQVSGDPYVVQNWVREFQKLGAA